MTDADRIAALEARLALAEARIAALELRFAGYPVQPLPGVAPGQPCNPPPGWPWYEVTCSGGAAPASSLGTSSPGTGSSVPADSAFGPP